MSARAGIGYDVHPLVDGRRLVLAGVEVDSGGRGLAGHSDADVVAHAVIDALLGAAGLGDIGQHFPDTDPRYRDADSMALLEAVGGLLDQNGLAARWVDVSVVCEAPTLSPYRDRMRARLAEALGLEPSSVSVKFTTNEGLGALGRGEGIAALASATVADDAS